ncbi:MAG TPA: protein kinase [Gemmatimonadaceae bacterium]|nr:protein kinase [Gemmatimonadaceae bacterium]
MTTPVERLTDALSDRYLVECELGKGGMATVYLARDLRHGRKVALKVMHPELTAVLGAERFLSEIHVTATLQHPHILPLFDSGQVEGQLFYVMPLVEGESLRARLDRERQLPIDDALRIAREVGSALDYAHRHGVVHRDIKPENVLLHDDHALVADFGIALAVSSAGDGRLTQTGLSLGTPHYMSPEQATGEREIDARSDLYSLAAVTYEMLGGEPPHTGRTAQAVIARMLTERPRGMGSVRPSVSDEVAHALDRALERLPADRWHSVREFIEALDGKTAGDRRGNVHPKRERTASRGAARLRARFRDPVILALSAVPVIASAFALATVLQREAPVTDGAVRFPLTLPQGTSFSMTTNTVLGISPDGRTVAFIARAEGEQERQLYVRSLDDPRVRAIPGTSAASNLFFSPDGKWLGFVSRARFYRVSLETGTVLPVAFQVSSPPLGGTWSNRGEIIASMGANRLVAIPVNGGPPRRVCTRYDADSAIFESQAFALPDGETVLFSSWPQSNPGTGRLSVASLSTGRCKALSTEAVHVLGVADDYVFYATVAGSVMAAPFNERKREITGPAIPLLNDVDVNLTTGAAQAVISRNGTLVYLSGSAPMQIVIAKGKGATEPLIQDVGAYAYPRYSPDARRLAVAITGVSERNVWVIDLATGGKSRITPGGTISDRPEWTPDGRRLLYRAVRSGERSELWWRASDLSDDESPLLRHRDADYFEGVITPDARHVVFQLDTAGADVMYRPLVQNGPDRPVAATRAVEHMARVSPDGRWVAYVSDESGTEQVYVQPFPGPGARIQISVRGGAEPVWSRDGRRLFFRDYDNLQVAAVEPGPPFKVVSVNVLFADTFVGRLQPHANYDVSPDGSHFVFLKETDQPEAFVVYNWLTEVRRAARRE